MDLVQLSHQLLAPTSGVFLDANGNPIQRSRSSNNFNQVNMERGENETNISTNTEKHFNHFNGDVESTTIISEKQKKSVLFVPRYQALIGETPMIDLTDLASPKVSGVRVFAKCEFLNPGFSMKDRIVKNIFDKAEAAGLLREGSTVVAASSGNTGAAVAMLAAMRGYKAVITTSPKCSQEKMDAIKAYGAQLLVSPSGVAESHPDSYMNMAKRLADENVDWFDVNQYDNKDNPEGHFKTMGPEIWEQTRGEVTHFVAGGSTGGTITGTGKYLKGKNAKVKAILADPYGSIFYDYFVSGAHGSPAKFLVEGVGKGSIPGCMNFDVIDDVIQVRDEEAFGMCHKLARTEGLMVGGSAGLNAFAAIKLANQVEEPAVIVTVLCDLGIKYLTKVYNNAWLEENKFNLEKNP